MDVQTYQLENPRLSNYIVSGLFKSEISIDG